MEYGGKPLEAPLHCDDEEEVILRLSEILKRLHHKAVCLIMTDDS
jgi:hypothetical protein